MGTPISIWGHLYQAGDPLITLGSPLSIWGHLCHLGDPLITLETSLSIWGPPCHLGDALIDLGTSLIPWGPPYHLGVSLINPGTSLSPWCPPYQSGDTPVPTVTPCPRAAAIYCALSPVSPNVTDATGTQRCPPPTTKCPLAAPTSSWWRPLAVGVPSVLVSPCCWCPLAVPSLSPWCPFSVGVPLVSPRCPLPPCVPQLPLLLDPQHPLLQGCHLTALGTNRGTWGHGDKYGDRGTKGRM